MDVDSSCFHLHNESFIPIITVIVSVLNCVNTIEQCLESVTKQTYPNKELIIVDGGSVDGTIDILKKYNSEITYWNSEPDNGIYSAWNKGLKKVKGDWICFLGADDYFWENDVLERMSIALLKVPDNIKLVYGQVMLVNTKCENLYPVGEPWEKFKRLFFKGLCLPHQGVMHRYELFDQIGKFDESFRIGADYELLLRELKSADAVFIPDIILTGMRQGGLSSNPLNSIETMHEIRRAQKMHGYFYPSFYWIRALVRVHIKLFLWNSIGEEHTRKLLDLGRLIKKLPPYWTKTSNIC